MTDFLFTSFSLFLDFVAANVATVVAIAVLFSYHQRVKLEHTEEIWWIYGWFSLVGVCVFACIQYILFVINCIPCQKRLRDLNSVHNLPKKRMFYKLNYDTVNMKHDLRCSFRASQVYVHMSIEHSVQSLHIFFLSRLARLLPTDLPLFGLLLLLPREMPPENLLNII